MTGKIQIIFESPKNKEQKKIFMKMEIHLDLSTHFICSVSDTFSSAFVHTSVQEYPVMISLPFF